MDCTIGFEISLIVVEAILGRCASFMIITAAVSDIFGGHCIAVNSGVRPDVIITCITLVTDSPSLFGGCKSFSYILT